MHPPAFFFWLDEERLDLDGQGIVGLESGDQPLAVYVVRVRLGIVGASQRLHALASNQDPQAIGCRHRKRTVQSLLQSDTLAFTRYC